MNRRPLVAVAVGAVTGFVSGLLTFGKVVGDIIIEWPDDEDQDYT